MSHELMTAVDENRLSPVITRLQEFFPRAVETITTPYKKAQEKIKEAWRSENIITKKALQIRDRINTSENIDADFNNSLNFYTRLHNFRNQPTSKEILDFFYQIAGHPTNISQSKEKAIEHIDNYCRDTTLAFLFFHARETAAKPFDKEKELRQIRAVMHMEMGDHVAMDTGDGKSKVVIPIYAIVNSIFEPLNPIGTPNLLLSSADHILTDDIKQGLDQMIKNVTRQEQLSPLSAGYLSIKLKSFSPDSEASAINISNEEPNDPFTTQPNMLLWSKINGVNITTLPQDSVIFDTTNSILPDLQNGVNVSGILPQFVFDEAYLLNESPYISHAGSVTKEKIAVNLDRQEDKETLIKYLTLRLVYKNIFTNNDVAEKYLITSGGKMKLTKKGEDYLGSFIKHFSDEPNIKKLKNIIRKEILPIYQCVDPDFTEKLVQLFTQHWSRKKGSYYTDMKEYKYKDGVIPEGGFIDIRKQKIINDFDSFLNTISTIKKGVDYISIDTLRDALRGILLKNRQYTGDVPFNLSLLEGKPLIDDPSPIYSQINFPTWLKIIAEGEAICLSNDLFYTDPWTGKRELSPMGKILEAYTTGYVIDLSSQKNNPQRLPIPQPKIIDRKNLVDNILVDYKTRGNRPELFICWDENDGQTLYKQFKKFGVKVGLITSMTEEDNDKNLHNKFANGELDILVTTGRKSFGADFKNKQDKFTDFRVNIINPSTVFQIAQAFGRRRLPKQKEDFSLYFDSNFIKDLGTILPQEKKHNLVSFPEFDDLLTRYLDTNQTLSKKEESRLEEIIITVLKKNQNKNVSDWKEETEWESYFIKTTVPGIKKIKREFIDYYWRTAARPLSVLIEEVIEKSSFNDYPPDLVKLITKNITSGLLNYFALTTEEDYEGFKRFKTSIPGFITNDLARKNWVDNEMRLSIKDNFDTWDTDLKDNRSRLYISLRQYTQEQVVSLTQNLEIMRKYFEKNKLSPENIDGFAVLQSPLYQGVPYYLIRKPDNIEEITVCHGQKLLKVKDNQIYFLDEKTNKYQAANMNLYNRHLAILNRLPIDFYENKKYIDIYKDGSKNTSFLRVKLKN